VAEEFSAAWYRNSYDTYALDVEGIKPQELRDSKVVIALPAPVSGSSGASASSTGASTGASSAGGPTATAADRGYRSGSDGREPRFGVATPLD